MSRTSSSIYPLEICNSKFLNEATRSSLGMDETRPRRSETRVRDEAASARVMMDSNLCEFLFFFFFSFLFSYPSSSNLRVHGQKKIASLPRISGSRTCAHAQFMQVGIRGWKVAPIDSNFSSSFVKIIPRLVEGRRFRKKSQNFRNHHRYSKSICVLL